MIKAVFFDVDGTLISFKTHRMPDNTRRSLEKLQERGILTFIATGRHLSEINGLEGWVPDGLITLNGAICVVGNETIYEERVEPSDIEMLTDSLEKKRLCPFIFVGKTDVVMNYSDATVDRMLALVDIPRPRIASFEEIRSMDVFQMMGFFGLENEEDVLKLLPNCHTTRWTDLFTDIVPKGVNKWAGISKVIERFGIKAEETMAFGDGGNDIDMLEGAGISVAMGNAKGHVKQSADYVTTSVDRNGITRALQHFGII